MRRLLGIVLCVVSHSALATDYPDHPIRLIVPQAAGSSTDGTARALAAELATDLGQPVIVDNRPGGALTLGIDLVAKASPDGYTIGMGPIGGLAINRHLLAKLPYNIERDFQPIALVARSHLMLAVSPKLPVTSVAELIALAKKEPGKLTNASSGIGTPGHIGGEMFKFMTETQIVHVPYRGGGAALTDLMAGHVDMIFEALNTVAPLAREGQVRALAVSGAARSTSFPDVPTMAEAGVPGYVASTWTGVIGPANLPAHVLRRLNEAINRAVRSESFKQKFDLLGDEPGGGSPEDFAKTIASDSAKWGEVVRRSNVRLD